MTNTRLPEGRLLTYATVFTLLRAALITPIVWCVVSERALGAFALGTLALLTDFIDGKLARALHEETVLGARLDHFVDKCFAFALAGALATMGVDAGLETWVFALGILAGILTIMFQFALWTMQQKIHPDVWDKSAAVLGTVGLVVRSAPLPHVAGDVVILGALILWFLVAVRAAHRYG
jgi:phosphatidylglycerophosphate synthase